MVLSAWQGGQRGNAHGISRLRSCQATAQADLKQWGKLNLGELKLSIKKAKHKLKDIEACHAFELIQTRV